tara:strand:- start:214 stop:495 length:282 start_codon:yes stop_codon:yes gene_type:complete
MDFKKASLVCDQVRTEPTMEHWYCGNPVKHLINEKNLCTFHANKHTDKLWRFLDNQWLKGDAAVLSNYRELNDHDLWEDYGYCIDEDCYKRFK